VLLNCPNSRSSFVWLQWPTIRCISVKINNVLVTVRVETAETQALFESPKPNDPDSTRTRTIVPVPGRNRDRESTVFFFFIIFLSLFQKIFSNMLLIERFQEMDSGFGVIHAGTKVTQLVTVNVGVKPPCHLADDAKLTLTWQHLGVVTIGAKLNAIVIDAKPNATDLIPCISIFLC
jgi:hypothetical protein